MQPAIAIGLTVGAVLSCGFDETVKLTPLPKGATSKTGYYLPMRATLAPEKPATITKLPALNGDGLFGVIKFGPEDSGRTYHMVLDEAEGQDGAIFIDTNGNGDLTDDAPAPWVKKPSPGQDGTSYTMYEGGAYLELGGTRPSSVYLRMYRFDPTDPGRAHLKTVVLYYRDYACEGQITLGGKSFKVMLVDDAAVGDYRAKPGATESKVYLLIDANGNGKFDSRGERFDTVKPFNIGGTTYEITGLSADGAEFSIVKSSKEVAEIPTPPDLSVGKTIISFKATTTDGKPVAFPGDYKGKVVMLDFWATWCGPCMAEVPNLVKVYEANHSNGFEILGISLDNDKTLEKIKPVTAEKAMTWAQVADGKYWDAEIAQLYVIQSIPAAFLVDGDTGEILAAGDSLRGAKLGPTVEAALVKNSGKK